MTLVWIRKDVLPSKTNTVGSKTIGYKRNPSEIYGCRYKHFYAKDESTHPSMVSTHQHIFKGKMCKNVETVSTHVKSVSTRVAVFQKSSLPRSTHSQSRLTLDPVSRTASLKNWVDTGSSSQNSLLHILDSASTLPPGQVDTLRKLFILKVNGCHVSL
ncbi:hypothetical protein Taro_000363 [Colocasia esculenta]|uniref:Uncharacterized protein n=1 Tax=Colocasia esculenta TaxID=4460 RepID=A0A843TGC5_COLES|nr:hypothetical protein [Colocasia esculenta]